MKKLIYKFYRETTLATKIRWSYALLLVPVVFFLVLVYNTMSAGNRRYETMINSVVMASEFSLDFKKDYDYETYLLIVGNKSPEESKIPMLSGDAYRVIRGLETLDSDGDNRERLESVRKYLDNLSIYQQRINHNLQLDDGYEANMLIWENDVQIVTSLLQESFYQYIYYEARDLDQARQEYQNYYLRLINVSLAMLAVFLLLIILLSYFIPRSITRPIRRLSMVTDQVAKGDLSVRSNVYGGPDVTVLSESMNVMIDKINALLDQVKSEQIRLRKAEFQLLQSQINPHFLYNTLDAIVWLAESGKQKEVVKMVGSLSEFFRTSLNQGKDINTIREELMHVRSYLEIQQFRYQDILQYEIDVPESLYEYQIPKITIQPLVENALYHGIKNRRGPGMIRICGTLSEVEKNAEQPGTGSFYLRIEDNGAGMSSERLAQVREGLVNKAPVETEIYGLYNVNERIRLNFGEQYGLHIESLEHEGTVVTIELPCSREPKTV